jgi:hypothetical protein
MHCGQDRWRMSDANREAELVAMYEKSIVLAQARRIEQLEKQLADAHAEIERLKAGKPGLQVRAELGRHALKRERG